VAISEDLFLAILSMDAYNRGAGSGVGPTLTGLDRSPIGMATVSAISDPSQFTGNSFSAVAYQMGTSSIGTLSGTKIISYRGTDNNAVDPFTGWFVGAGAPGDIGLTAGSQADLAIQFFTSATGGLSVYNSNPTNVVLTGVASDHLNVGPGGRV
jgi:hypothetical protein